MSGFHPAKDGANEMLAGHKIDLRIQHKKVSLDLHRARLFPLSQAINSALCVSDLEWKKHASGSTRAELLQRYEDHLLTSEKTSQEASAPRYTEISHNLMQRRGGGMIRRVKGRSTGE